METFLRAGLGNAMLATVLALGAASAGCLLRHRPAVRHALWLLVLLKLITPPLWVVPLVGLEPTSSAGPELVASVVETDVEAKLDRAAADRAGDDRPVENRWVSRLPRVALGPVNRARLAIAWLTGSILSLTVTGLRIRRWNRLLRFVEPAPDDVQDGVDLLANTMGIARPPCAYWFPGASAPMLWAFGCRPSLIVPCKLWGRLDDRQRTTLLVHELAHLRRKDHWVRIVELLATAFYWWLPLAWIARWALREAEEQCCDAWVVWTCPDAHRAYAETLLDTVDFLSETGRTVPLAASGFGHAHHLKRRVTMIMQGTTPRGLSWTGLLGMFGLATLLLPLSPTWAQKADDEADREVREEAEDPEGSEVEVIKRKLSEEIRRLEKLEKETRERAHISAEKARERAKKERSESSDEARSRKADADRESAERDRKEKGKDKVKAEIRRVEIERERISPKPRTFNYHYQKDLKDRSEDARVWMDGEAIDNELDRAKLEVEHARAQLRHAELQFAKLAAELKARRSESKRRALEAKEKDEMKEAKEKDEMKEAKEKDEMKAKGRLELHLKPDVQLRDFKFELRKDLSEKVDKAEVDRIRDSKIDAEHHRKTADLIENKIRSSQSPERHGKIAELKVLREKYIEALGQIRRQARDFDHDTAANTDSRKLESVVEELKKQIESLNEERSPKKDREESR